MTRSRHWHGGVFAGRSPNADSPLGGHIRDGGSADQTSFIARSIRQLVAAASFHWILSPSSPPVAHGLASAVRVTGWKVVSACHRIAGVTETSMLCSHIVTQNLTFAPRKSAVTVKSAES